MIPIVTDKEIMPLSTARNFMEITMQTKEKVEEESMVTEPMEDRSTRMKEETYCSTMTATQLMSPSIHKQFMLSNHQPWSLVGQHHQTEVEVHHEEIGEPNEAEDSDKPEVIIKDSKQTEEHKEETTKIPTEDLVEIKILTVDPKDNTITDKGPKEAQGEVPTRDREVDALINMQIRGTVWFARKEATTI